MIEKKKKKKKASFQKIKKTRKFCCRKHFQFAPKFGNLHNNNGTITRLLLVVVVVVSREGN